MTSKAQLQPLQGMSDLTDPELGVWRMLERKSREIFALYGYSEIRTPILEKADVFSRSLGETTDVVRKEMYAFTDQGGRKVAMRPEGTAGVVRHVANGGPEALDSRLYYTGPMFRAEKPQAGRRRQFHQIGVELFGDQNPFADAECIALQAQLLAAFGFEHCEARLNTRGLPEEQNIIDTALREQLRPRAAELCPDCGRRLEGNVFRVLDCKEPECRRVVDGLPALSTFMSAASREYFDKVCRLLEHMGVPFTVEPRLVRGLDYYVHTVWEITHNALGAQCSIAGGGRYRIDMGTKPIEGVGFALGMERLVAALEAQNLDASQFENKTRAWLVALGEQALMENMKLAAILRNTGISCGMALAERGMKAQMRAANRSGATWAIIRGETELAADTYVVKNMETGDQEQMDLAGLQTRMLE